MTVSFVVHEVRESTDVDEVRRLVLAHALVRATTPGVEYMRADALALPGPYVPPRGGLWLARANVDAAGVGCVALRPLSTSMAEVKRMYVDPQWRGHGIGRALLETLIDKARALGYGTLRLGTLDDMPAAQALYGSLDDMTAAQSLYGSLGFAPIERYRADEMIDTRFYEKSL